MERIDSSGLPPYKILPDRWMRSDKDTALLYKRFVFAQEASETIYFATGFFPTESKSDQEADLALLQRVKGLYEPQHPNTRTVVFNVKDYWFMYTNLWRRIGVTEYIVNTHASTLKLAVGIESITESSGHYGALPFLQSVVNKGIDGLIDYLKSDSAWDRTIPSKPFLRYAKGVASEPSFDYSDFTIREINTAMPIFK